MSSRGGFSIVEALMETVSVGALLLMVALFVVQSEMAVSRLAEVRAERHYTALKLDLQQVAERQIRHFLERDAFAVSTDALNFEGTEGSRISVTASGGGWAAAASHDALGPSAGCAIYHGTPVETELPVLPSAPLQVACTD